MPFVGVIDIAYTISRELELSEHEKNGFLLHVVDLYFAGEGGVGEDTHTAGYPPIQGRIKEALNAWTVKVYGSNSG